MIPIDDDSGDGGGRVQIIGWPLQESAETLEGAIHRASDAYWKDKFGRLLNRKRTPPPHPIPYYKRDHAIARLKNDRFAASRVPLRLSTADLDVTRPPLHDQGWRWRVHTPTTRSEFLAWT